MSIDQPVLVDLGGLTVTLFYIGRGHCCPTFSLRVTDMGS